MNPEIQQRAARVRLLLMDVDGVLTDGLIYNVPGADGKMVETKTGESLTPNPKTAPTFSTPTALITH